MVSVSGVCAERTKNGNAAAYQASEGFMAKIISTGGGNLYIAARGVVVYSPDGKLLGKIAPPVNPRNLSFGYSDLRTLYMVGNSIFRVRLEVAGSVQY